VLFFCYDDLTLAAYINPQNTDSFFHLDLVGGFNPFENISQNGNLAQVGVKIKNI